MVPNETKLLNTLSNNDVTFFIPPYQRNYEWTTEQCEVFLADVLKTYELNSAGNASEHFFGSITYFETEAAFGQPHKLVLIDGQQRITTTMLFLVALRDILKGDQLGKFIDNKYLKNENVTGDSEYKVKLKQVETDWVAYKNIILGIPLTDTDKQSAVYHNYKYFYNKLESYKDDKSSLSGFIEKGLNKFSVITIELQPDKNPWENPQEIFESMNSLGKPLSLADLVRNYLLLGLDADTQTKYYNQYWLHIEKVLSGKLSDYIRDYMQAHEAKPFYKATEARYKDLYALFKKIFEGKDVNELLTDLSYCSDLYSYCVNDADTGSKKINAEMLDIKRMGITTSYSFLMELFRAWKDGRLTEQNTADILASFKIYCMRRRILALTQAENKNFPLYVKWIPDLVSALDKKQKMFELLAKQESSLRLPNDIELIRHLETMNFYNFAHCEFFFALIEESLTKSRPDISDGTLQKEHIMPRTLTDEWKKELGDNYEEVYQTYLNTIGNLTLIRHNQELSNKTFSEKKKIYDQNAGLQIARKEITDHDKWNEDAIKGRASWITDYLLNKIVPIPDEMRKVNNYKSKEGRKLSFLDMQLIGLDIEFIDDPSYTAHVVTDKEVEFEGKRWHLSPLTREIQTRRGKLSPSGAYSGAQYWAYDGMKLADFV